jgi:hypothetical protein
MPATRTVATANDTQLSGTRPFLRTDGYAVSQDILVESFECQPQ